jgi:hypothetical protein
MRICNLLKLIGALMLLVSITLPMSSCTVTGESADNQVSISPETNAQSEKTRYKFLLEYFDAGDPATWVTIIAFGWPLLVLGILHWKTRGRITLATRVLEPVFLVGSLAWIEFIATFFADRIEIGAYLAFCAIAIYAFGMIYGDVLLYRAWQHERQR